MRTLPIIPDEDSLKMLQRVKRMYYHSSAHSLAKTDFDNMLCILSLDNTVEYLFRALVRHLKIEELTGRNFDDFELAQLASNLNKATKEYYNYEITYLAEIKLLRQTRNLVQHGAIAPNADIDRFGTIVERMFEKIVKDVYGFSSKELRLSEIIIDSVISNWLKKAESYIDEENWIDSIVCSRNAFENAYFMQIKDSNIALSIYPSMVFNRIRNQFSEYSFKTILDELEANRLNINTINYRRVPRKTRAIMAN